MRAALIALAVLLFVGPFASRPVAALEFSFINLIYQENFADETTFPTAPMSARPTAAWSSTTNPA